MPRTAGRMHPKLLGSAVAGISALAMLTSGPASALPVTGFVNLPEFGLLQKTNTPVPRPRPSVSQPNTASASGSHNEQAALSRDTNATSLPTLKGGNSERLRAALRAIGAGKVSDARSIRKSLKDPVDRKIVDWRLARSGSPGVSSAFITRFTVASPNWPSQKLLRRRAEQALAREKPSTDKVIAAFRGLTPISSAGMMLLADALLKKGEKTKARAIIADLWRDEILSNSLEKKILTKYGSLLKRADHKARADMLLYNDRANGALRLARYLSRDQRKLMDAWIAVIRKSKKANGLLKAVPRSQRSDPGYAFAQIKYLRRAKKDKEAIKVMLGASGKKSTSIGGDEWWVERRIVSRLALDMGRARDAYKIAAAHSAQSPAKRAEAEFHAGWYALRFVKSPKQARRHFQEIEKIGKTPITRSRAFYWLGRTAEAQGDKSAAKAHYQSSAEYKTAFYGQLAREKLGKSRLGLTGVPKPTQGDRTAFSRNELVLAIKRLENAKFGELTPQFYRTLGKTMTNPGELALVTQMAQSTGRHQLALMVGKTAVSRGVDADLLAFPTAAIPRKAKVHKNVGKPVVYAIARQESAFNPGAISSAGARGLLQLMPATARATAKKAGVSYSKGRLTSDAAYNATLGAAHLGELLDSFNGSYVLTFAAYNAGSSRSHKWMKLYGDPRTNRVDTIDWIERIPFTETRNYVQRIMENLVIYRARFERDTLQITKDLKRG